MSDFCKPVLQRQIKVYYWPTNLSLALFVSFVYLNLQRSCLINLLIGFKITTWKFSYSNPSYSQWDSISRIFISLLCSLVLYQIARNGAVIFHCLPQSVVFCKKQLIRITSTYLYITCPNKIKSFTCLIFLSIYVTIFHRYKFYIQFNQYNSCFRRKHGQKS